MPECIIEIKDEVNVKIHDLDLVTRRQLEKKFKYFLPHAYHVPAYKLGRLFRDSLGRANQKIAKAADEVILMVSGIPMYIKKQKI